MEHNLANLLPTKRLQQEVVERLNPRGIEMLVAIHRFCYQNFPSPKGTRFFQVTSIYRTQEEQDKINASILAKDPLAKVQEKSTHSIGNAFDLSLRDQWKNPFRDREIAMLTHMLNSEFPYDPNKPILAAYRHVGTADHIHCQCNWRLHGVGSE